ncbi:MAG: bifunctional precorrin-2 dehydrogenase/sirohydrochlorin ferrochelatase [Methanothrix sp.]|jgi:precorrin-2 dehydrogenase/sirohydrochlorin ferrochelatase|nr:bifunctional precorrin-2 dehydrogenase/sirohydrochlorin ferrochelatase [Methanothrix sp.]
MAGVRRSDRRLLPLFLDLEQKLIVIFGGGRVGEHKARLFLDYGRVRVVSKDFTSGLLEMKDDLELVATDLSRGFEKFLVGAFIAIPATSDSELNKDIEREASKRGVLINKVDGVGDVVVPSIIRKGSIAIAITTEIPGLTKYLRLRLEEYLTRDYQEMAKLLAEIRPELKRIIPLQEDRARIIGEILEDEEVWSFLEVSYEKAYMKARSHACQDERDSLDAGYASQSLHRRD